MRDADIRIRGDDFDVFRTYLNRRYATMRVGDAEHDCDYQMRLYLCEPKDEAMLHILRHNYMVKTLFEGSSFLKSLYVNFHSWVKTWLYDANVKFDMFTTYEVQVFFISFLVKKKLLKANHESEEPTEWLEMAPDIAKTEEVPFSLARLFIEVLLELSVGHAFRTTDYSGVMPKQWVLTAKHPIKERAQEYSNQYTFYQMKLGD
jgi:hypothetical protein